MLCFPESIAVVMQHSPQHHRKFWGKAMPKHACIPHFCSVAGWHVPFVFVLSNFKEAVTMHVTMQLKLTRGRGEVREAAALFAEARDRVDGVEPGPLGGLQRRLMEEVASHAAAYAVIAALESEAAGDEADEDLAEGVEV